MLLWVDEIDLYLLSRSLYYIDVDIILLIRWVVHGGWLASKDNLKHSNNVCLEKFSENRVHYQGPPNGCFFGDFNKIANSVRHRMDAFQAALDDFKMQAR